MGISSAWVDLPDEANDPASGVAVHRPAEVRGTVFYVTVHFPARRSRFLLWVLVFQRGALASGSQRSSVLATRRRRC